MAQRKSLLLRIDPRLHEAIRRWADEELRSVNAQIEFLLRDALARAGRLPTQKGPSPGKPRGRAGGE